MVWKREVFRRKTHEWLLEAGAGEPIDRRELFLNERMRMQGLLHHHVHLSRLENCLIKREFSCTRISLLNPDMEKQVP